jgi:hypothetical protein
LGLRGGKHLDKPGVAACANDAIDFAAVCDHDEAWHAGDSELGGDVWMLSDVDLSDCIAISRQTPNRRLHRLARDAGR